MSVISTAIFVHGLARKPSPQKLEEIWLWALGRENPMPSVFPAPNLGIDLSLVATQPGFNYYADVFYGEDYETDLNSYYESVAGATDIASEIGAATPPLSAPSTPREVDFVRALEATFGAQPALAAATTVLPDPVLKELEIAGWLPAPLRQAIIKKAAMEAYYFLFNKTFERPDGVRFEVRTELRSRLLSMLVAAREKSKKLVVVSHSMGTMVAYDVLRNCPGCPKVDTLITIGSPLGIKEVQEELRAPGGKLDFPAEGLHSWVNIYDPLDPICGADPAFSGDFAGVSGKRIRDIKESNWGSWRHTATHYLSGTRFREELRKAVKV